MIEKFEEKILRDDIDRQIITGYFRSFSSNDKIYFKRFQPKSFSEDHIHLIVVHDLFEYHGQFKNLINKLILHFENKISITCIDLKGHGLSSGSRSHIEDFSIFCQDLASVINIREFIKPEVSNKTILLGHGLGGLIILQLLEQYEYLVQGLVSGVILSNPIIKTHLKNSFLGSEFLTSLFSDFNKIRLPRPFNGHDLTDNVKSAHQYNTDPLIHNFFTTGMLNEILISSKSVRNYSYFIDLPTLFLTSQFSQLVDLEIIKLFQKGMRKSKSVLRNYPHFKHDLFHHKESDIVFNDIINWLDILI